MTKVEDQKQTMLFLASFKGIRMKWDGRGQFLLKRSAQAQAVSPHTPVDVQAAPAKALRAASTPPTPKFDGPRSGVNGF